MDRSFPITRAGLTVFFVCMGLPGGAPSAAAAEEPARSQGQEKVIRASEHNRAEFVSARLDALGGSSQMLGVGLMHVQESVFRNSLSGGQGYAGMGAQLLFPLRDPAGFLNHWVLYGTGKFAYVPGALSGEAGLGLGRDAGGVFPVATLGIFPLQFYYTEVGLVAHLPLFHETPAWMSNFQLSLRIHLPATRYDLTQVRTWQDREGRIREETRSVH